MTERRALLTDREREIVAGDADVTDEYRYQTISRVRRRFDRLDADMAALGAHGDLLDELRERVCESDDVRAETPADTAAEPVEGGEDRAGAGGDVSRPDAPESVEAAIGGLDLPGSGAKVDARREAVRAAVGYLRENGTATPADFKSDVYPDHRARYTTGEDPANSWWKNAVSKGLRQVADRTGTIERPDTSGVWAWTGSEN